MRNKQHNTKGNEMNETVAQYRKALENARRHDALAEAKDILNNRRSAGQHRRQAREWRFAARQIELAAGCTISE